MSQRQRKNFFAVFTLSVSIGFLLTLGALKLTPQVRAGSPRSTAAVSKPESAVRSKAKITNSSALRAIHDRYVKAFVESDGFGESRLVRFDDPFRTPIEHDGQIFRVRKLELISLQNHDVPVAYVNDFSNPVKNRLTLGTTRPLNDFEKDCLTKLRRGHEFVFRADENRPGCVGAIRAQTICLECHDAKVGDLLGAFSYDFTKMGSKTTLGELNQLSVQAVK